MLLKSLIKELFGRFTKLHVKRKRIVSFTVRNKKAGVSVLLLQGHRDEFYY